MQTVHLTSEAYDATFISPMREVTQEVEDPIDIWPYVSSIPADDLAGYQIYDQFVEHVYRDATSRFDHVLVMTKTRNVYLGVIIDLVEKRIHGHHLLDLNQKYGLRLR